MHPRQWLDQIVQDGFLPCLQLDISHHAGNDRQLAAAEIERVGRRADANDIVGFTLLGGYAIRADMLQFRGQAAVDERARYRLGMMRNNEVFVQVVAPK